MATKPEYWDRVGAEWRVRRPHRLWRDFTDHHQLGLILRWLGLPPAADGDRDDATSPDRLLKTDLFDEVAGRGLVQPLLAAGLIVTAIDISPVIVTEAAARHPGLRAVSADVRMLPFPDASFDTIFSGSTLDHFETSAEIQASLNELRRVIRPGGRLMLTMDNLANPIIRLRNSPLLSVLRGLGVVPYQVGVTLGPKPLVAAVEAAGFEVVEVTAVMHCPRAVAVAIAPLFERFPEAWRTGFIRCLDACEWLQSLPTRWLTGHYIAIHAVARDIANGGGGDTRRTKKP